MGMVADLDEPAQVRLWREEEAMRVGLAPQEAEVFAYSDGDLDQLRTLIADGCPAELAFWIVT